MVPAVDHWLLLPPPLQLQNFHWPQVLGQATLLLPLLLPMR